MRNSFIAAATVMLLFTRAHAAESSSRSALPQALPASDLSELSGGASPTGIAISSQTLTAVNSGNSVKADTVITGSVNLQPGAFSGFNGVGNFVFNTGNNNNLQGTLSVTVLTPPSN
jgi:hypothetical protein